MMMFSIGHQIHLGISITLELLRNSLRYGFSAFEVGASGVPRFTSKIPVLPEEPC